VLRLDQTLDARENLILSLKEVLGEPPAKSTMLKIKPRETFYSVIKSADNPEMEKLLQKQQMGMFLTEDEQVLMAEYTLGGNVSGSNTVMRRIYPPVLSWSETNIKTTSGNRYPFIYCTPNAAGPFPAGLVLDPEIAQQLVVGKEEYNKVVRRMPVEADPPWEEPYRGRYITHSPLGNQLMCHGVSVIIPIQDALEKANEISLEDWKSVIEYYAGKKQLDPQSLFLVATFIGLIFEEPEEGIFETQFPQDEGDAVKMLALQDIYEASLKDLECPTLIFRHKQNPALHMNDALILKPLMGWKRPMFMSLTDYPIRTLGHPEKEEEEAEHKEPDPRFCYDADSVKKITQRMLYFIQQNGKSQLNLLPEESMEPRSRNQSDSLLKQFDQMTKRLTDLTEQYADGGSTGDDSGNDFEN
jgi:hypothetical protein